MWYCTGISDMNNTFSNKSAFSNKYLNYLKLNSLHAEITVEELA